MPPPDDLATVRTVDVVFPEWINHHGTMFAGRSLELLCRVAFIAASRATRQPMVLAQVIGMEFLAPIRLGEVVIASAALGRRSARSQLVQVQAEAEDVLSGRRRLALRGSVVMVIAKPTTPADPTAASTAATDGSAPAPVSGA